MPDGFDFIVGEKPVLDAFLCRRGDPCDRIKIDTTPPHRPSEKQADRAKAVQTFGRCVEQSVEYAVNVLSANGAESLAVQLLQKMFVEDAFRLARRRRSIAPIAIGLEELGERPLERNDGRVVNSKRALRSQTFCDAARIRKRDRRIAANGSSASVRSLDEAEGLGATRTDTKTQSRHQAVPERNGAAFRRLEISDGNFGESDAQATLLLVFSWLRIGS